MNNDGIAKGFKCLDQMQILRDLRKKMEGILARDCSLAPEDMAWLAKSDQQNFEERRTSKSPFPVHRCHICGKQPLYIWNAKSLCCKDYPYGVSLCGECILELADQVKKQGVQT